MTMLKEGIKEGEEKKKQTNKKKIGVVERKEQLLSTMF